MPRNDDHRNHYNNNDNYYDYDSATGHYDDDDYDSATGYHNHDDHHDYDSAAGKYNDDYDSAAGKYNDDYDSAPVKGDHHARHRRRRDVFVDSGGQRWLLQDRLLRRGERRPQTYELPERLVH